MNPYPPALMLAAMPRPGVTAAGVPDLIRSLHLTPARFFALWSLCVAWTLGVMAVTAARRRRRGIPVFRPRPPGALFEEGWRSGRSLRNWRSRLGGARNCLWIVVAGGELWTGPHFPFCLLSPASDLDRRIPAGDILSVEPVGSLSGNLRVRFRRSDGTEEAIEVDVRDAGAFLRALAAAGVDASRLPGAAVPRPHR